MFNMTKHETHQTGQNSGANAWREPTCVVGKHLIELIPCRPREKCGKCVSRCSTIKKCTDVSYQCSECEISACMTPCFEIYHTKKYITRLHRIDESYTSKSTESETEEHSCGNDCWLIIVKVIDYWHYWMLDWHKILLQIINITIFTVLLIMLFIRTRCYSSCG